MQRWKPGGGGTSQNPTSPTVAVTPASSSITTAQNLSVTIVVSGTSGTPTGSVVLSSGTYASSATTLSSGSATITIPSGSLAAGSATLTARYTPDSASSTTYSSALGTASMTVTQPVTTPTVSVTPASNTITIAQNLGVTIAVSGTSGTPPDRWFFPAEVMLHPPRPSVPARQLLRFRPDRFRRAPTH